MADLSQFSRWAMLVGKWERGEPIEKQQLLKLLNDGTQPPAEALKFIAAIIKGEVKYKEGIIENKWLASSSSRSDMAFIYFFELYGDYIQESDEECEKPTVPNLRRKKGSGESATEKAIGKTATLCGTSRKRVQEVLAEKRHVINLWIDIFFKPNPKQKSKSSQKLGLVSRNQQNQ